MVPGFMSVRMQPTDATDASPLHLLLFQSPDIGAVVHFMRRNSVTIAVARQEHHILASNAAEGECARSFPLGGAYRHAVGDVEVGQLGEAAAADDG
jgi:ribulose-5-phosphate 4-epimerase/fuculose-1-phosphate aldolase